jgi:hypothetical protein
VKVSVPRLVPEQKCRQVEKEICNTRYSDGSTSVCLTTFRLMPTFRLK